MNKNFLISTGGSGGHVMPALILYQHLSEEAEIIISTDKRGLKFINQDIPNLEIIDTPRLKNIFFLPFYFFQLFILTVKSLFFIKTKKIEKIFSMGGYMSLPVIFAAKLLNLDIYLLEPNQVLGRTNKFFLSSCKKIFCYTNQIKNFPENFISKIVNIDPLISRDIYKLKKVSNQTTKFTILIIGGSQGANIFDMNLKKTIVDISKKIPIKVIHQTNEKNIFDLSNFYSENNIENKIFSFENNLFNFINQTNLCITRAGASSLAELSFLNIPFIAVPLPTSKDNHQFENAKFYQNKGCCWLVEQNIFEEKIGNLLNDIILKKIQYNEKKENLKKLNYQNSWENVNQKISKAINEN